MSTGDTRSISSSESKSFEPDITSYRSSSSSLDESTTSHINALLRNGVPADDIVFIWLREFSYEHYAMHFLTHGYDIQTIIRMTPEVSSCFVNS
jgi:ABC-type iron transport system FetAB ATPase subunit